MSSAKLTQMNTVLTLCGAIIFFLFVALLIAVLFEVDDKARHIADKQKDLINSINSNGGNRRRSYGSRSLIEERDTTTVRNTYTSQTFTFSDPNPQDDLIKSTFSNGYTCAINPPIDVLPSSGFFDTTFRTLERTWTRLRSDLSIPGVAIGIAYNQRVIYNGTFGSTGVNNNPVTSKTLFRIGGLTRLFTAILTYQQRDKGQLRLEQALKNLLPGLNIVNPFTGDDISIKSVLTDLSGLPRNAPPGCEPFACNLTTAQVLQLIAQANLQLINPPYLLPSRSDLGWSLLGRGMESLSGFGTYESQVKSSITDLLGMPDTTFALSAEQNSRLAPGFTLGGAITPYEPGWNRPWGGLYSSLDDMLKILLSINLVDSQDSFGFVRVLPSETLRELLLPSFMNPDSKTGQGSPFQIITFMNKVVRTLGGVINGYSSHMISIPGLRLSMVALGNLGEVDMSQFLVPAAKLLIPLIQNQLIEQAPGPNPAPNPALFVTTYSGRDSRGIVGLLTVTADSNGVLTVADDHLTGLAYQLDYVGNVNNGTQRFKIHLVGTDEYGTEFLTCLNIFNLGLENDYMDFLNLGSTTYRTIIFQGEQYQKVAAEGPAPVPSHPQAEDSRHCTINRHC